MPNINRYITAFALGINSGLIYALLNSTLTAYLDDNRVSLAVIGLLSLRMLPYSLKPVWSPFVDALHIKLFKKGFGQRKSWLITSQCVLIVCLMLLSAIDVQQHLNIFFGMALLIAFMGATSDIALDGYIIELFEKELMSKGSSLTILGFRIGLFVSGALGLYLAAVYSWQTVFMLMGIFLIPSILVIYFSKDNRIVAEEHSALRFRFWIKENFVQAIVTLFKRDKIIYIILLLGFYKVSDGYLTTMFIPFLTRVGFLKADIASAKAFGIIAGIAGTFVGVKIIDRVGLFWSLLGAEILSAFTNLLFPLLIYFKQNQLLLYFISSTEYFCSGISNVVLFSYMSLMCNNKRFTASHFALLTSFSVIFRILLSSTSGWVVAQTNWFQFFIISAALSLPSILCMYFVFFKNKKLSL